MLLGRNTSLGFVIVAGQAQKNHNSNAGLSKWNCRALQLERGGRPTRWNGLGSAQLSARLGQAVPSWRLAWRCVKLAGVWLRLDRWQISPSVHGCVRRAGLATCFRFKGRVAILGFSLVSASHRRCPFSSESVRRFECPRRSVG